MARKLSRLLTDSLPKKEQALAKIERDALVAERKKHQRKYKMYSDEAKIETVKTYLALGGNLQLTSGATGITYTTLCSWKHSEWWKSLVSDIKKQEKLELSARTKRIVEKSMELLQDRLEQGDFYYDQKKGVLVRRPVTAQVIHRIAADMIDRKEMLDKSTEERVELKNNDEKLADLAKRFADLAEKALSKPKPVVEVTDVVFVEEKTNA